MIAQVEAPLQLQELVAGRDVVVLGSAPLERAFGQRPHELLVAVNGGISSAPDRFVDVWVLNSRSADYQQWGADRRRLSLEMVKQGADRHVGLVIYLAREDEAPAATRELLRRQRTRVDAELAISKQDRLELEFSSGGRTGGMEKHALSAGLFAAALVLLAGAEHVRLAGFSWSAGYQYLPGDPLVTNRGHEAGDKAALAQLEARYAGRLEHALAIPARLKEKLAMAGKTIAPAAPPPAAAPASTPAQPKSLKVRAKALLFYNNARRRPGEVFVLRTHSDFKRRQMEYVGAATPIGAPPAKAQHARPQTVATGLPQLQPNAVDLVAEGDSGAEAPAGDDPTRKSTGDQTVI